MYTKTEFIVNGDNDPISGIRIAGNQYNLIDNITSSNDSDDKLTLLLTHPNGFVKEMWEPYLHILLAQLKSRDLIKHISKVIAIDIRNQGDSAQLNEGKLLDPPFKWVYNEKDILAVIKKLNLKRGNILGIGNSLGAVSLLTGEASQPGTFRGIIAMDPSIFSPYREKSSDIEAMFRSSGRRRPTWPNKKEARAHFESRGFYQAWHPDVLEKYLEHGLKTKPNSEEVTLKCSPKEEMKTFLDDYVYQPTIYDRLPNVHCPTIILAGEGPGGVLNGRQLTAIVDRLPKATSTLIPDTNHLIPFENPKISADVSVDFIQTILKSTSPTQPSTSIRSHSHRTSKL